MDNCIIIYCGIVFLEVQVILHNLWHFLIIINDLVCLDFVVAMLQFRCRSSAKD